MFEAFFRRPRVPAELLWRSAAITVMVVEACTPSKLPVECALLPSGRSLRFLPERRVRELGINLQTAASLGDSRFTPALELQADDAQRFDEIAATPVGSSVAARGRADDQQDAPANMCRDMGFLPEERGH